MGKSVYLELKLEEEGAAFLGDWFGKGDKEIVLPVWLKIKTPNALPHNFHKKNKKKLKLFSVLFGNITCYKFLKIDQRV